MGTNYTVATKDRMLHVGKSSMGWVFSLRVYPELGINTLYDWMPILLDPNNSIANEYGRPVTAEELLTTITCRQREEPLTWSGHMYTINAAEPGPNNLVRGIETEQRKHGEGTWNYCNYEFS